MAFFSLRKAFLANPAGIAQKLGRFPPMPTYEYACNSCEHQFEQFQSIREAPLTKCPKCGKPSLKRLVGAGAGLIFKGSGFYITDYKKSGAKEPRSAESKASTDSTEKKTSTSSGSASKTPTASTNL